MSLETICETIHEFGAGLMSSKEGSDVVDWLVDLYDRYVSGYYGTGYMNIYRFRNLGEGKAAYERTLSQKKRWSFTWPRLESFFDPSDIRGPLGARESL